MFGKDDGITTGQATLNSMLGQGCKIKGDIEIQGTMRIDGTFEGNISCPETLIIGKTGVVKGEIKVKNAVIGGKLIGNIAAANKIELQSGSHVEGDIQTGRLVIDEGVFFEGNCKMGSAAGSTSTTVSHQDSTSANKDWAARKEERKPEPANIR
ncbi:MAG: polymer-forming cytoskeletal protein [Candidatus Krumholzibacteria bacterium]|nr:polymer-forming cytoskeletal protein [Candidatus Krumholzibacteria bacterium]MDH4336764.1 polymer-forming cytoskeletal protein [Candidatus Krumholzibacteria bacterium]MDH5269469.1 polymer-forming cytoskeletal protein [Candidatus Krumholzibacteria bacterium]